MEQILRIDKLSIDNTNASKNSVGKINKLKLGKIIKLQAWIRGIMFRRKRLPLILYVMQKKMQNQKQFQCSKQVSDGRINSCIDEKEIVALLTKEFNKFKISF